MNITLEQVTLTYEGEKLGEATVRHNLKSTAKERRLVINELSRIHCYIQKLIVFRTAESMNKQYSCFFNNIKMLGA
jgi:hypothetical protein